MPVDPKEPWRSFLLAIDEKLDEAVSLHCIGGFAVTLYYGVSRTTSDLDFLVADGPHAALLQSIAGTGTELQRRFKVSVHPVAIVTYPEDYRSRLVPMWETLPARYLRLFALEAYDLALTKLERNQDIDRDDISALAEKGLLEESILEQRYRAEVRPNIVAGVDRCDLTMEIWAEIIRDARSGYKKAKTPL